MRRFLVVTSLRRFTAEPHIHAKLLVAALLISNGIRKDAEAVFYLVDLQKTVKILGSRVKRLFPDEDSSVGFLKKAFAGEKLTGVIVKRGASDLTIGTTVGPGGRRRCMPNPPFTYVVVFEPFDIDLECDAGLGKLPPHHQVVIINIETDRLLYHRR
ncbi:hypothetical protein [Pyrobaculum islandicum]|uniref:hypothetical protein n=1 Tax=Pyrobaculum islandicum TaxID=2277 RepID=UPI00069ED669|nr:hypothetical protein [Pyrobaculum islandicum]